MNDSFALVSPLSRLVPVGPMYTCWLGVHSLTVENSDINRPSLQKNYTCDLDLVHSTMRKTAQMVLERSEPLSFGNNLQSDSNVPILGHRLSFMLPHLTPKTAVR